MMYEETKNSSVKSCHFLFKVALALIWSQLVCEMNIMYHMNDSTSKIKEIKNKQKITCFIARKAADTLNWTDNIKNLDVGDS